MDFSRIKKLVRQGGEKFIVIENGEPELVILSFEEYERLIGQNGNIGTNVRKEEGRAGEGGYRDPRFISREFDLSPVTIGESIGLPRNTTSTVAKGDLHELVEVDIRGLPVRLEDLRVEDLPI